MIELRPCFDFFDGRRRLSRGPSAIWKWTDIRAAYSLRNEHEARGFPNLQIPFLTLYIVVGSILSLQLTLGKRRNTIAESFNDIRLTFSRLTLRPLPLFDLLLPAPTPPAVLHPRLPSTLNALLQPAECFHCVHKSKFTTSLPSNLTCLRWHLMSDQVTCLLIKQHYLALSTWLPAYLRQLFRAWPVTPTMQRQIRETHPAELVLLSPSRLS